MAQPMRSATYRSVLGQPKKTEINDSKADDVFTTDVKIIAFISY
jgi:hypothetical protein